MRNLIKKIENKHAQMLEAYSGKQYGVLEATFLRSEMAFLLEVKSDLEAIIESEEKREDCGDWIHQERINQNDDKFCPICGKKLQNR